MDTTAQTASAPITTAQTPPWRRRLAIGGILTAATLGLAAWGAYYMVEGRYHEETDDAYVNANLVTLTPQIGGTVVAVNADDTQRVTAGETLVALDAADAQIGLATAQEQLARTTRQVSALYVDNAFYDATIAQRQIELARAKEDLARRQAAADAGGVSTEDVAHARQAVSGATAALKAAQERAKSNRTLSGATAIAQHPDVRAAATKLREAWLTCDRTRLPAPVSGYIARRSVQVGQRVGVGSTLLSIVPLDKVWIDANFKEVQLQRVRIGQPVTVSADFYGSTTRYHGKVVGFSAGTGSAFAALPAQNATGNWIKVVQRLPVRIEIDDKELAEHPLRVGLSMQVDVDTHTAGQGPLQPVERTRYSTNVFEQNDAKADADIARIIAENLQAGASVAVAATAAPSLPSAHRTGTRG